MMCIRDSTPGSAISASSPNTARKLASWARRKSNGAPSARFAAYTPPGRRTRAASRAYSTEVSCAGTREPPNTSATSTSALPEGAPASQARASAVCTVTPDPAGSGRFSATSSTSPSSNSTTSCREPGRVAAAYRGSVSAPPPRCSRSSAAPGSATQSRTCARRRAYSNSRCSGSSRSTYDCGAPSTVSSQARSRSTSGISLAVPWPTARITGICSSLTAPLSGSRARRPAEAVSPPRRRPRPRRAPRPARARRAPPGPAGPGPVRCARKPCGPARRG